MNQTVFRKLRACIVGLGQVGLRFDLEAERQKQPDDIWTHFTAYERSADRFDLVAAVDPDETRWKEAQKRRPELLCYRSLSELLKSGTEIDVMSICSPDAFHLENLKQAADLAKGFLLEKPVSSLEDTPSAIELVKNLKARGKVLYVNYVKRTEPSVIRMLQMIQKSSEKIRVVECRYSGPFMTVGCHALDLINSFSKLSKIHNATSFSAEEGFGLTSLMETVDGAPASLTYTGKRHDMVFELDVMTDRSRYLLTDNLCRYTEFEQKKSVRYSGYREYFQTEQAEYWKNPLRFVHLLQQIADDLDSGSPRYENVDRAIETQVLIEKLSRLAGERGIDRATQGD